MPKIIRQVGGITYETDTDEVLRHKGAWNRKDSDGTSDHSRHHPVFNLIGDGWTFLLPFNTSSEVWWIHESGFHIKLNVDRLDAVWNNMSKWFALKDCLTKAIKENLTGYHYLIWNNKENTFSLGK